MPSRDDRSPVIVASFTGLGEAELARGALESQGIDARLQGEQLVAVAWHLSNAVGGIKLIVPAEQRERAGQILAALESARPQADDAAGDDAAHNDAADADAADAAGPGAESSATDAEPGPADRLAEKAWQSSLIGLLLFPPLLHLWAAWLLVQSSRDGGPRTPRGRKVARRAATLTFLVLCCAGAFVVRLALDRGAR